MKRNQPIVFEAINVETDTKISGNYLSGYLGIKSGDVYEESKVKKISSRIRELAFIEEKSLRNGQGNSCGMGATSRGYATTPI